MPNHPVPLYAVILGTDAILAAQPVDAVQLSRACQAAGFDFVAPVSWGEELVATRIAQDAADLGPTSSVMSSCPFVAEQLRAMPDPPPTIRTVPPPVACARYLRAAFQPRPVHITYVGACPGAAASDVDERLLPDVLFARFVATGIDLFAQPRHFDAQVPPDRARYASLPGGAPEPRWLMAHSGAQMIEAAPVTVHAVAQQHAGCAVVMDLAAASRCTCARNRAAAARPEPPRATAAVLSDIDVRVTDEAPSIPFEREVPQRIAKETDFDPNERMKSEAERRATFAEHGLSDVEATPPQPLTHALTTALEPWSTIDPR